MAKSNVKNIKVQSIKLTKTQKKLLVEYLTQKRSINTTAERFGQSTTRIYSIVNTIMRHASSNGIIDIEELLKNY